VRTYWFNDKTNFGDQLTPWLLPRYGVDVEWADYCDPDPELIGVGSLLQLTIPTYAGAVWGTGLILDDPHPLPRARIAAVRGALTAALVGAPTGTPLGDPGLLLSRYIPQPDARWALGVVPHKNHIEHPTIRAIAGASDEFTLIDPTRDVDTVAAHIASCAAIFSTSLHGLVVADSYGTPAAWGTLDDHPLHGPFKFCDHETAVRRPEGRELRRIALRPSPDPGYVIRRAGRADPDVVDRACAALEAAARTMAGR
jgi:hypothetical protein